MPDSLPSAPVVKKDPYFWVIIGTFSMSLVVLAVFTWLDAQTLSRYGPGSGPPLSSETLMDLLMAMREVAWAFVMLNCFGVATCAACYFYGKKRWLKTGV